MRIFQSIAGRRIRLLLLGAMLLTAAACGRNNGAGTNPGAGDTVITIFEIPGVVIPVVGMTPVADSIETVQYTGTITWEPSDSAFAALSVYTANIELTAKTGFTFTGVAENSFTVAGAAATNAADTGTVTAVFAATGNYSDTPVTFLDVTQTGGVSNSVTTTALTLTFSTDPTSLTADNITITGAAKGALSGTGTTRSIGISGITVADGESISVTITSPAGFAISGSPLTAVVYKAPRTIDIAAIPGIVVPVRNEDPVTTAIDTAQYTGTVTWSPSDTIFAASTVYTANIVLTPKSGFTLSGVPANFFTVDGATATNAVDTGNISAVFPETAAAPDIEVTFSGVTQTGGVSNSVTTTALTLTFSTDPTSLTADNITITGATKGALSGTGTTRSIGISGITVANGATVSVTVTSPAGFSITGSPQTAVVYKAPRTINIAAIPGVVPPVLGAVPVTTSIDTAQYTGTITWSPSDTIFAASTVYTANIVLTPRSGFTLTGVPANFFTVDGATATNAVDTGNVSAVFPKTRISQTTEHFAGESHGSNSFSESGLSFVITGSFLRIDNQPSWGWTGTDMDDYYIDNFDNGLAGGIIGSITNPTYDFYALSMYLYPADASYISGNYGDVIIRGILDGYIKFTYNLSGENINTGTNNNGFTYVDLSSYSTILIDEIEFEITESLQYLAIDAFKFN